MSPFAINAHRTPSRPPPLAAGSARAVLALLMLSTAAGATPICRWVDEAGRTQRAQVVPDPYSKVAVCTDSQKHALSPEQRRAVEQRAAEAKCNVVASPQARCEPSVVR